MLFDMKKTIMILAILLFTGIAFGQEVKEDTYTLKGDVIEATLYHDNGVISQTGFYTKDNKLQGKWTSYDISGNRTAVAQYNNGEKVGTWYFYQGDIMKQVTYENTKIKEVKTWEVTDTRVVSN